MFVVGLMPRLPTLALDFKESIEVVGFSIFEEFVNGKWVGRDSKINLRNNVNYLSRNTNTSIYCFPSLDEIFEAQMKEKQDHSFHI